MELKVEPGRIFAEDDKGKVIAEVTFSEQADDIVTIDHTLVDDSLRGQGVAGKLVEAAAEAIKKTGKKPVPVCSYAVKWFEKHNV